MSDRHEDDESRSEPEQDLELKAEQEPLRVPELKAELDSLRESEPKSELGRALKRERERERASEPKRVSEPKRASESKPELGQALKPKPVPRAMPVEVDKRPLWPRLAFWGAGVLLVGIAAAALTVVGVVNHYSKDLPDVHQLEKGYSPPQVTRILARDGTLLANIFSERRTVVPIERIPDHVKSAFLAAEDAGFFQHKGLDYLGMLRAMAVNLRAGQVRQGGSTITQQVVKNVLLDNERSYKRKIRETILAYQLEQTLEKEQILGMYMNHIYLGHGRYGVEEAGRYLFGKHVEELSVAEAALLAGIVAAPERYSPRKDKKKALIRRKFVLDQMLQKGFMTQELHEASLRAPVRLAPPVETESDIAPEMVGHARRILAKMVGSDGKTGGYTVHTTIDPALQVQARAALRKGLDDYLKRQRLKPPYTLKKRRLWGKIFEGHPHQHGIYVGVVAERRDEEGQILVQVGDIRGIVNLREEERFNPTHLDPTDFVGPDAALRVRLVDDPASYQQGAPLRLRLELGPQAALVALHPQTREVLAAVGSYEALPGGLDRSFQTKRQPGSTFKPIVYSYALDTHQVTAATPFEIPLKKKKKSKKEEGDEEAAKKEPTTEVLSLRDGVARSNNRVAQEVFRTVGGRQAVGWAQALGIESKLAPTAALMLGAYEVTVTEMAGAFSVFASGGTAKQPSFVTGIESGAGPLELPAQAEAHRVMDPAVAYLTTSLLSSVVERGTAKRASSLRRPLAGKTGTTNRAKDAWFIGYSTDLVVAVWVGFDDALPLGWGESGATSALPIWMKFMKDSQKGKPATEFSRPAGLSEALIDAQTGLLARYGQEDAVKEIFLEGTVPTETAPEPGPEEEEPEEEEDPPEEEEPEEEENPPEAEENPPEAEEPEKEENPPEPEEPEKAENPPETAAPEPPPPPF